MKPGSILIADNVLWYGKVIQTQKDEETKILDLFNRTLAASKNGIPRFYRSGMDLVFLFAWIHETYFNN